MPDPNSLLQSRSGTRQVEFHRYEGSQHGPGFDCSQGDYFQEEGPQKWIAMSSYTAVILGDNLWWPETHKLVHLTKDSNKVHSFPKARHRSLLDQVKAPE